MPKSEERSYDDYPFVTESMGRDEGSLSPFTYLCTILIIALLGLTVLYSSSYAKASSCGLPHYWYFFRNLIAAAVGLGAGLILNLLPMKAMRRIWIVLLPLSVLLLVLSLVPSLSDGGVIVIASHRLVSAPMVAFLSFPFLLGSLLEHREGIGIRSVLSSSAVSAVLMVLTLFSGGLGWYLMMALTLAVILRIKGMGVLIPLGSLVASVAIAIALSFIFPTILLSPVASSSYPVADGSLYDQELYASLGAIRDGGITGTGLGGGLYKLGVLENPESSFIFASFVEELGYLGAILIAFLLILIAILGARTVSRALAKGDDTVASVVAGLTLFIVLRFAFSMGYASGLLPFPGIMLPFFSYDPAGEAITVASSAVLYRMIHVIGRKHNEKA